MQTGCAAIAVGAGSAETEPAKDDTTKKALIFCAADFTLTGAPMVRKTLRALLRTPPPFAPGSTRNLSAASNSLRASIKR